MNHFLPILLPAIVLVAAFTTVPAQDGYKIDVFTNMSKSGQTQDCAKLELGSPIESIAPEYPLKARSLRIGGAVKVTARIGKDGSVIAVSEITGPELLLEAAKNAAAKTKFTTSLCDGIPVDAIGILTFNFVPEALTDVYVMPVKAEEFGDVGTDSPFYEAILTLTENYKLAFGYADGNYHSRAPLTKGDFAHSLRLTLDLLRERAEVSRKIPGDIDLYFPVNPLQIKTAKSIIDLDSGKPYADSVAFLISKYDIALTDENRRFEGMLPLSHNGVIRYWTAIFGKDAVPVNFSPIEKEDRIMTRGEFALFLQESLYVLTYKVLP